MLWINNKGFLIPPQPLTNFEIEKYYQNEPTNSDKIFGTKCCNLVKLDRKVRSMKRNMIAEVMLA